MSSFPDDWPAGCPPADAETAGGRVYRLVKHNPVLAADFQTHAELGKMPKAPACLRHGLSVFRARHDALHQAALLPFLGDKVASGELRPEHGMTKLTRGRMPSHTIPGHRSDGTLSIRRGASMKWNVQGEPYPLDIFGDFEPVDVLYDYDGPRIFTIRSRYGDPLFVYQCDEDETASRFVVVPCDVAVLHAVQTGYRSVRDALTQPWTWVVDQPHGHAIRNAWRVELASIPTELLPAGSVMLLPSMAPLPERAGLRRRAAGARRRFPRVGYVERRDRP